MMNYNIHNISQYPSSVLAIEVWLQHLGLESNAVTRPLKPNNAVSSYYVCADETRNPDRGGWHDLLGDG